MINSADENRRYKARELRYKKAVLADFNLQSMTDELYDISTECDAVRYTMEDEDSIINALDGDEDEAHEFKMLFSDLSSECETLFNLISPQYRDNYISEYFDDFFAGVSGGGCFKMLGYDSYEEDYFALCGYENQYGSEESRKRLERLTKSDLIQTASQAFRILTAFLNVRYKYDYLKAAFDVIKEQNSSFLSIIKDIESLYLAADSDDWNEYSANIKAFDKAVSALPDKTWLE